MDTRLPTHKPSSDLSIAYGVWWGLAHRAATMDPMGSRGGYWSSACLGSIKYTCILEVIQGVVKSCYGPHVDTRNTMFAGALNKTHCAGLQLGPTTVHISKYSWAWPQPRYYLISVCYCNISIRVNPLPLDRATAFSRRLSLQDLRCIFSRQCHLLYVAV